MAPDFADPGWRFLPTLDTTAHEIFRFPSRWGRLPFSLIEENQRSPQKNKNARFWMVGDKASLYCRISLVSILVIPAGVVLAQLVGGQLRLANAAPLFSSLALLGGQDA